MFRYLTLICLLIGLTAACTPTTQEPTETQLTESEEMHEDEHESEEDHDHEDEADHEDEHEHEEGDDHREHGAHEHGVAELTIAWSGNELAIDLETPAFNILGFEHSPHTEEEQKLLDESLATLEEGNLLLILPQDADCTLMDTAVHTELGEADHADEDAEHDEAEEETHSDIDVAYNIQCQHPDKIEALDASELFAHFPNFEALHVQWVSDTQQSAQDLTPDDSLLSLK
ncbi:MAG: DUF2796 domain-containing protein [Ardenticatenaceae bacterium]|nr:DUF2796 domain-containing protein [Ardenticatenaceae bacterium]